MNQNNKIDINELNTFDIKEYFFKIVANWKLFVATIFIGLLIANIVNRRTQKVYNLNPLMQCIQEC